MIFVNLDQDDFYLMSTVIMMMASILIVATGIWGQARSDTASRFLYYLVFQIIETSYWSLEEYSMMPELFGNQVGGNVEVSEQVAEQEL